MLGRRSFTELLGHQWQVGNLTLSFLVTTEQVSRDKLVCVWRLQTQVLKGATEASGMICVTLCLSDSSLWPGGTARYHVEAPRHLNPAQWLQVEATP